MAPVPLPLHQKVYSIPPMQVARGILDTQELPAACFKTLLMEVENYLPTPIKDCITQPIVEGLGLREDNQPKLT